MAKKSIKGVTIYDPDKAFEGYTLVAPQGGYNVWLVNMEGEIVYHWPFKYQPGLFARLLPNGNLLYQGLEEKHPQGPLIVVRDASGKVIMRWASGGDEYLFEMDPGYNIVWEYRDLLLNHDFYPQENGNIMLTKYTLVPEEIKEKIKGGIEIPKDAPMWCDKLEEIDREGNVVWEWFSYDYMDFDLDRIHPLIHRYEWTHMNTCSIMPNGDVLGAFRTQDLIFIIDKETKKVKWRYGQGDGELSQPHEPTPLENGNILVFDNGEYRRYSTKYSWSRVVEIDPKTSKIVWEYKEDPPFLFFSGNQCGCQRLANGNTLITESLSGRIFEVNKSEEKVWEYLSPFYGTHAGQKANPIIYRAYRYGQNYSGIKKLNLDPHRYRWVNAIYGQNALQGKVIERRDKP